MLTRREMIMVMLEKKYYSLQEIAYKFGADIKEILEDFDHIKYSVKGQGKQLKRILPQCKGCGFVFKERSKIKKPSKCPRCRHERIEPPKFKITTS